MRLRPDRGAGCQPAACPAGWQPAPRASAGRGHTTDAMSTPPPYQPDQRTTADAPIRTTCLVVLTIIAVGFALVPLRPVLVPLLIALLFTYCLRPLIDFQVNRF